MGGLPTPRWPSPRGGGKKAAEGRSRYSKSVVAARRATSRLLAVSRMWRRREMDWTLASASMWRARSSKSVVMREMNVITRSSAMKAESCADRMLCMRHRSAMWLVPSSQSLMSSSSLSVKSADMGGPCAARVVRRGERSAPLPNPPATRFVRADKGISPQRTQRAQRGRRGKGSKGSDLGRSGGTRRKSWEKVVRFPFWSHGARANAVIGGRVGLLFEPQRHEEHKGG